MKIGIDCSSIKEGGNITHLTEILNYLKPSDYNISMVVLWCSDSLATKITPRLWLKFEIQEELNGNFFSETFWKIKILPILAKKCDIVFCPTGYFWSKSVNYVAMCRNMLYYEKKEINRYGYFSKEYLKNILLRFLQVNTFKKAKGIIFISEYAKEKVQTFLDFDISSYPVISHGVSKRFASKVKLQKEITSYSLSTPYQILYISNIAIYKHQWILIEAISKLFQKNYNIQLTIVGKPIDKKAEKMFYTALKNTENSSKYIKYLGQIPHKEVHTLYKSTDLFVYSSSCENMPNILIEAMTSGLPIAASNMGVMPEFLKDAALYYNPLDVQDTMNAIEELIVNPLQRQKLAQKSKSYAEKYSWERCCKETFNYLSIVAQYKNP